MDVVQQAAAAKTRKPDRRRAKTRAAILDAATALFLEQGVDATSADEIAEVAGLSVGTLYFHFGRKDGVVFALVDRMLDTAEEYLLATRSSDSALERLLDAGDAYYRFATEQPVAFRLVSQNVPAPTADVSPETTEIAERMVTRVNAFLGRIAADLEQAMDDGEIDRIPLDEAAAHVWASWNGLAGLVARSDALAIGPELAERTRLRGRRVLAAGLGGAVPQEPQAD